jgi:hypothetical protein
MRSRAAEVFASHDGELVQQFLCGVYVNSWVLHIRKFIVPLFQTVGLFF